MLGAEAAPAGSAPVADEPRRAAAEPDRRDEPDAWTTDWADEELESQPASAAPWSMTPEPMLDETWGAAGPPQPWSPTAEPPPDPWLAPEPTAVRGGPAEAARATASNPVEEAFNEWFGPPSEPAAPAGAQPPMETGDEERSDEAAAEDESDEDLEMFRAWLQSLKK